MKIAIISNLYEPYVLGGAEIYVEKIVEYITKQTDNQVILITTKPFKNISDLKAKSEIINNKLKIYRFYPLNIYHSKDADKKPIYLKPLWHFFDLWNIHSYLQIKEILKKEKPDLVHTHNVTGFSTSIFSAIKSQNIPQVHTLHDYQFLSPWAMLFRNNKIISKFNSLEIFFYKSKRKFSQSAKIVLAPSQFTLDKHTQLGFFKKSKNICLPLGINLDLAEKIQDNYINIVYFGQLVTHKGINILLEAFTKLKNKNVILHIAGDGPLFKKLQHNFSYDKKIKFYGFISGKEKQELWQKADIAIVPSIWYENSPVTIYEGFKNKTALIVSEIGGMKELIKNNQNGLYFKVGNSNDLKEKIELLIKDKELRQKLTNNAYQDLINNYTIEKHLLALENIYKNAIS